MLHYLEFKNKAEIRQYVLAQTRFFLTSQRINTGYSFFLSMH